MKQNTVKVKERYNWPVTILLIIGIVLVILLPLYMALMIAIPRTYHGSAAHCRAED